MVLRISELHQNLQHLNGMLSYWHFMHLVEAKRIPGIRVVDRWLFSPDDLDNYRRSKYGELEDIARTALEHPAVGLTEKQETICRHLLDNERPSAIARRLQQSRQAVHSQISLIREKVSRMQALTAPVVPDPLASSTPPPSTRRATRSKGNSSLPI
jgi:DNA-binding CsgD family transcriptional regulator